MSEIFAIHEGWDSLTINCEEDGTLTIESDCMNLSWDQATTMCNAILAHINEQNALRAAEVAKQGYEEGL